MTALRAAAVVVLAGAASGSAAAEVVGGAFETTGLDVTPRFFHAASRLASGEVMVTGGMRLDLLPPSLVSLADCSFFDPVTGAFTAAFAPTGGGDLVTPLLATPRSGHAQTTLADGRVLVTGGRTGASGTSAGTPVASVERFDPADGLVHDVPPMSTARADHTATLLADGRVLVAGGGAFEIFDPDADTWSAPVALARTRSAHAAVRLPGAAAGGGDGVLLVGGAGSGPATMELIDPAAGTTTLTVATLDMGVDDLAAGRLADGTVLIVGGQDVATGDTVALTYRYDPVPDVIACAPAPSAWPDGLADHALVVLGNAALVCGGESQVAGVDTELDLAALYDGGRDAWIHEGPMASAHDDLAAVGLADGRVLIVDGAVAFFGQAIPTAMSELFVPQLAGGADVDCDGAVGFADLLAVLAAWGRCPSPPPVCAEDVDGNGTVGFTDVLAVLASWDG